MAPKAQFWCQKQLFDSYFWSGAEFYSTISHQITLATPAINGSYQIQFLHIQILYQNNPKL